MPADLDKLIQATCVCGWQALAANAEGLAVQHARRERHTVTVTIEYHPHHQPPPEGQMTMVIDEPA